MPNQEGPIVRMNGEQHVWAFVPLCDKSLHLPLQQHGGQRHAGVGSRGGRLSASLLPRLPLLSLLRGRFVGHLVQVWNTGNITLLQLDVDFKLKSLDECVKAWL